MNRHTWGIIFFIVIFNLTSCVSGESTPSGQSDEGLTSGTETIAALPPEPAPEYEITVAEQEDNDMLADIRVINLADGQEILTLTLENVYLNHYHAAEYHNGHLYVIKEFGSDEDGWIRELWKYNIDGEGVMLYSSVSLDFRVAPNESLIAVVQRIPEDHGPDQVIFLDPAGNVVREFAPDTENMLIDLGQWSSDSTLFWGTYQLAYRPLKIFRVDPSDWEYTDYDLSSLPLQHEYALNADSGKLIFSDYPPFFEVTGYHMFLIKQEPVTLYLYDLTDQSQRVLSIAISQSFDPEWIGEDLIEYRDPAGQGRIQHDLIAGSTILIPVEKEKIVINPAVVPPGFEAALESLEVTGIPPILPPEFPAENGLPPIVPYLLSAENGKYQISLDYGEDCLGAGVCHYGILAARMIGEGGGVEATLLPFFSDTGFMPIQLSGNIPGYFLDYECGASCSDAQISWIYEGIEYMIGMKAGSIDDLTALANAALENSLPAGGE